MPTVCCGASVCCCGSLSWMTQLLQRRLPPPPAVSAAAASSRERRQRWGCLSWQAGRETEPLLWLLSLLMSVKHSTVRVFAPQHAPHHEPLPTSVAGRTGRRPGPLVPPRRFPSRDLSARTNYGFIMHTYSQDDNIDYSRSISCSRCELKLYIHTQITVDA